MIKNEYDIIIPWHYGVIDKSWEYSNNINLKMF